MDIEKKDRVDGKKALLSWIPLLVIALVCYLIFAPATTSIRMVELSISFIIGAIAIVTMAYTCPGARTAAQQMVVILVGVAAFFSGMLAGCFIFGIL